MQKMEYNTNNNDYNTVITTTKIKVNIQYNYLCLFSCSTLHIYKYCAKRHIFGHTLHTDDENPSISQGLYETLYSTAQCFQSGRNPT